MTVSFRLLRGDFRSVDIPHADAVYADPPYYGNEYLYNCKPVALLDVIAVMESVAPVRALSMSQGMRKEAEDLVTGRSRLCVWVKPWTPNVSDPSISWEPVLLWGDLPASRRVGAATPRDTLVARAGGDNPSPFPTPKPDAFASWVVDLLGVGVRPGSVLVDIFSGSGAISRAAMLAGWNAVGVDSLDAQGVWTGDPLSPVSNPVDAGPADIHGSAGPVLIRKGPTKTRYLEAGPASLEDLDFCPVSLMGFPIWIHWWTNRHQMKPVYYRGYVSRTVRPRIEVEGVTACSECHVILDRRGSRVSTTRVADGRRLFVRKTVAHNKRRRLWLREYPTSIPDIRRRIEAESVKSDA